MQEKDCVISQVHAALHSSQRQVEMLKATLSEQGHGEDSSKAVAALADASAQSLLHEQRYQSLRRDYNRLLNKCAAVD